MRARRIGGTAALLTGTAGHLVIAAGACVMLLPFVWMFLTSIKPASEIFTAELSFLPSRIALAENYGAAISAAPVLRFVLNGVIVSLAIVVVQIAVSVPCAYALAKHDFPAGKIIFSVILVSLMLPPEAQALPMYLAFSRLGLLDSYAGLILPFIVSPFAVFLLRQVFRTFPDEIIEAARLDGYSEAGIVWKIILPSAWPAVMAFAVFSIVAHWNYLYWPMVAITSSELAPPPVGLLYFKQGGGGAGSVGALMAAATISTLPLIIAFLFAQKSFIRGITMTGFK